ncbi:conserved hypothetical protein [Thermus scotoductus SA-01]|uniref:Uncharacterized protein n=3 Tax=Thermus scotoductus TaxID=37636 RepID=A0A430UM61_THESC|nr:conserved hypothetical protein [Thermus scotoductus SA-01]RTI05485.1 hypothetical protein CSW30_11395 [Thermus scotoductus]
MASPRVPSMAVNEESLLEVLSRYVSPRAAENLLRRALAQRMPTSPGEWAHLLEETLWPELRRLLPFREMPPELKALAREWRELAASQVAEAEATETGEEELPVEAVDLEDPLARQHLAKRLARLEGVTGVVVAGKNGKEELFSGEPVPLDLAYPLLRRQGYGVFYAILEREIVALRPLAQGYIGLLAKKEANIGRLLHALRRLISLAEVSG